MELLRDVSEDFNGKAELYKLDDGSHVVVSTANLDRAYDATERAVMELAGVLGGYAISGEETMAFPADAEGNVTSWTEVAVANGEGSRDLVLAELAGT